MVALAAKLTTEEMAVETGKTVQQINNYRRTKWFKAGLEQTARQQPLNTIGTQQIELGKLVLEFSTRAMDVHAALGLALGKLLSSLFICQFFFNHEMQLREPAPKTMILLPA
jgi:hypothetical protein